MFLWHQMRQFFIDFWQDVSRPLTLSDEEKQFRVQLLSTLLIIIIPTLVLIFLLRLIFLEPPTLRTYFIFSMTFITVFTLYFFARTGRYQLTINTIYVLGTLTVLINAATSRPPYYEISYLLILPFVAAMLISLRETILWIVATFIAFTIFGTILILPDSARAFSDLLQQAIVFNIFILLAGYQRNRFERERQKLALEKGQHELIQFLLTSISHDFKTPLSIINSSVYLLKKSTGDEHQIRHADKITQQTKHLNHMMTDINTLAQLEFNFSDTVKKLDFKQILTQTISNLQPRADSKHINIETEFLADSTHVCASYDSLIRITTNLLDNAIRYTPDSGTIIIKLFNRDEHIILEIEDNGIGIDAHDLEHIFDPFFRSDRARSSSGSGLGLALVKKSIELLNGEIEARSDVGQGTTLSVRFEVIL